MLKVHTWATIAPQTRCRSTRRSSIEPIQQGPLLGALADPHIHSGAKLKHCEQADETNIDGDSPVDILSETAGQFCGGILMWIREYGIRSALQKKRKDFCCYYLAI